MNLGIFASGKVMEYAGESVQTDFFWIGVPLVPLESIYVFETDATTSRAGRSRCM